MAQSKNRHSDPPGALPSLALMVAIVAVGISAILIRLSSAQPVSIAFHRLLFTTAMVAPVALWRCRQELMGLKAGDMATMWGVGLVLSLHFSTWITSLSHTTVAASNVLVTAHPIFVGAVAHFLMGERLTRTNAVGIAVAYGGVIVLFSGTDDITEGTLWGNFLALVGGVLAGIYIMAGREMRRRLSVWTYATVVYGACTVFLLIFALLLGTDLGPYPPEEYGLFLAMAIGPGILGHTLYNWSLGYVGARTVSLTHLGEPILSAALAVPILNEVPDIYTVIGVAIILAGVYMALDRKDMMTEGKMKKAGKDARPVEGGKRDMDPTRITGRKGRRRTP